MERRLGFRMPAAGQPEVMVIGPGNRLLFRKLLAVRGPGPYSEEVPLPSLPLNTKMELVVKVGRQVVVKYELR